MSSKVTFLGARGDIAELLSAGDGFVMSSKTEGLPMALLEAMAAGLPCVATAVGGIPELLAHGRGLLVPPRTRQPGARDGGGCEVAAARKGVGGCCDS